MNHRSITRIQIESLGILAVLAFLGAMLWVSLFDAFVLLLGTVVAGIDFVFIAFSIEKTLNDSQSGVSQFLMIGLAFKLLVSSASLILLFVFFPDKAILIILGITVAVLALMVSAFRVILLKGRSSHQ